MMNHYSIECAQAYDNDKDHSRAAQELQALLARTHQAGQEASLVALVDDTTYEDKSFDFDHYSNWLRSKGFKPDLVARESEIVRACDVLKSEIDYSNLSPELATELRPKGSYNSQLFIAAWCLLRLGYIEDESFDPTLRAERLVNILPESFKPGEDQSLEIIRSTRFADAANSIEYIFIPEAV